MMRIAVIGTGYVGTVAGACFAESGNEVVCVDRDPLKIKALSKGDPVIYEPGLEDLLKANLVHGRIRFTTSPYDAVERSDIIFMTVGTPPLPSGEADLSHLKEAAQEIGRSMSKSKIIVNKSTVPVGTHRKVAAWIRSETDLHFEVVSNPEFLREGAAIHDFLHPDRVVIGTRKAHAYERLRELYIPFVDDAAKIIQMDPTSAELTKYACNAFLATRISFMNELSGLCEKAGGDIECIRRGMGLDHRIGQHFLNAGIGYGGSCFPKDIRALLSTAKNEGMRLQIVQSVEDVNERQKMHLLHSIHAQYGKSLAGKSFAVWGLAFKPNTDDIREAPALVLIERLLKARAKVQVYDPAAMSHVRSAYGSRVTFCADPYDALHEADALIIATEWEEFKQPDLARVRGLLKAPMIFDGRNALDARAVIDSGFRYFAIGRGSLLGDPSTGEPTISTIAARAQSKPAATENALAIEPQSISA